MEAIIKFKDGTEIEAEVNGNCFIIDQEPDFPIDLSEVTVEEDGEEKVLHDVSIVECASVDGRYWFALQEEDSLQKTIRTLQEENAMLTECILEMSEIIYA